MEIETAMLSRASRILHRDFRFCDSRGTLPPARNDRAFVHKVKTVEITMRGYYSAFLFNVFENFS